MISPSDALVEALYLEEALYQVFTTPLVFPPAGKERHYESLCRLGYAEIAAQGHAPGSLLHLRQLRARVYRLRCTGAVLQ